MYKIFYALVTLFWILDVGNMPFMEVFDTSIPINGFMWLMIWIFLPNHSRNSDKDLS